MIAWLSNPSNTKPIALVIFFATFVAIVWWVYGSKQRGKKLESYKNIPFLDDETETKAVDSKKDQT